MLVVGGDVVVEGVVFWLAFPSPLRALTPTLSRPTGAGECLWQMRVLLR